MDHSIPLSTLINVHYISLFILFIMVICIICLYMFVGVNLIILFNKDFFLNKVKNRYALWYVKYVIFKSRVDILVLGIIITLAQCFILYILFYLIKHPIIINT